jgi:hypothetical protein
VLLQRYFLKVEKYLSRYSGLLLFLMLILSLDLAGCAARKVLGTVRHLVPLGYGKEVISKASRFKLVDDFVSRDFANKIGGRWKNEVTEGSQVEFSYSDEDAFAETGHSLVVKYAIAKEGEVRIQADLNALDISKAEALSLWFAYSAVESPRIKIRISDTKGRKREVDVTARLSIRSKAWQEILIPVRKWGPVDFNRLSSLEIAVQSKKGEEGSFLIDQVSFYGGGDVFFESLQDNLLGFPKDVDMDRDALLALDDWSLLERVARDTWSYFANIVDRRHQLPLNRVKLSWQKEIGDYVSPTDIAFYYLATVSALELGFIREDEAKQRITSSLKTVALLPKWKGFLYNYYNTTNLQVTNRFVSTVDNGWFAAALMVVKARFREELGSVVEPFLAAMDFHELYDPHEGRFHLGYDDDAGHLSRYHYGLLVTEARVTSYVAIAKGDVEEEHWLRLYRVLPPDWDWQNQVPQGVMKTYDDLEIFQGYYEYEGKKIVPSWGGSLFEFLMPALLVKEGELGVSNLGENNRRAAEIHRDYALLKKRYPVWGISPCMLDKGPRSDYLELGIKRIGAKGYREVAVVTPHASFLALEILPEDAITNIRRLLDLYPVYGEYGFYDSVALRKPLVTKQYLALDQGMILVALANALRGGAIREYFHSSPETQKIESLLGEEKFFDSNESVIHTNQLESGMKGEN